MLQRSLRKQQSTSNMCGCTLINQYTESKLNEKICISTQQIIYESSQILPSMKKRKEFKTKRSLKTNSNFNNKQNKIAFQLNSNDSDFQKVKVQSEDMSIFKTRSNQQDLCKYQQKISFKKVESKVISISSNQENIRSWITDREAQKRKNSQQQRIDTIKMKQSFQTYETQLITKLSTSQHTDHLLDKYCKIRSCSAYDLTLGKNSLLRNNVYESHLNFNCRNQLKQKEIIQKSQEYLGSHKLDQLNFKETETIIDFEDSSFQLSKVINDSQGNSPTNSNQNIWKRAATKDRNIFMRSKLLEANNINQLHR